MGPSTFSESVYRRVRSSPVFDPELDIVAAAPEGTFASCLTAWADERTGTGNFEPVGTDPAYARRGIGREAISEAMRRLKAKGMHTALVGTAAHNTGGLALYPSCGFELVANEIRYTLPGT